MYFPASLQAMLEGTFAPPPSARPFVLENGILAVYLARVIPLANERVTRHRRWGAAAGVRP
jgi:hypothetical protein